MPPAEAGSVAEERLDAGLKARSTNCTKVAGSNLYALLLTRFLFFEKYK